MVGALMLWSAAAFAAPILPPCAPAAGAPVEREPMVGTGRWTARLALGLYQALISPADGRGCQFFPACSTYTRQAVHRHGPLIGLVMGFERIQRNHDGWHYSPCRHDGYILLRDPVSANDWWFRSPSVDSDHTEEAP